jgi:tetratricopeptide (TPR) repeat protein
MPALERIYIILGEHDKGQLERLSQALTGLLSYVNLTSNVYLVGTDISEAMPQVERIQKVVTEFLRENLFARLYVHFVHRAPNQTVKEIDHYYQYYYQNWKRSSMKFDREGYMHQEVPRLMLLPVIVPHERIDSAGLMGLLDVLKGAFLIPSLYLAGDTLSLVQQEDLRAKAEKVYYGRGDSLDPTEIVSSLCRQSIIADLSSNLESGTQFLGGACTPSLIISAREGMVYSCEDRYSREESLGNIYATFDADALMGQYDEMGKSQTRCSECKERAVESFAQSPLPQEMAHEVGALLYHFGTLHQEANDHVRAIQSFNTSFGLSPVEETGAIHFQIGLCYTKAGSFDKALEAFKKTDTIHNDKYFFHFYMGFCYFQKEDYLLAIDAFSKALSLNPEQEDLVRILVYMGTCHNNLGAYEEAIVPLERAKEYADRVKEIYSTLGYSYFQIKDYDKAIDNLEVAVELDPHSAVDYASLGANYREKDDVSKAIAMFQKALELDPSLAPARENLDRLGKKL